MNKIFTIGFFTLITSYNAWSQGDYKSRAQAYITQYAEMAVAEQQRSGIPAAITLAQGIYETNAGLSELATEANNHFGIKCKKEWRGETFAHTDDAPNECFRKYSCAAESYKDHSDYLKQSPRYAGLFTLEQTDYASWAHGLKKCGYATNPKYAHKLIRVIEDFNLQQYTFRALGQETRISDATLAAANPSASLEMAPEPAAAIPEPPRQEVRDDGKVRKVNGLKAVYCHKGDVLLEVAVKHNIRYAKLLEFNELPDAPLTRDMYIYLEKKNVRGNQATHLVAGGETIEQIAQDEGMQLRLIRLYNMLQPGEQPAPGTTLYLQKVAPAKPSAFASQSAETKPDQKVRVEKSNSEEFIPTHRKESNNTDAANSTETTESFYGAAPPAALATEGQPVDNNTPPATPSGVTSREDIGKTTEEAPAENTIPVPSPVPQAPVVTTDEKVAETPKTKKDSKPDSKKEEILPEEEQDEFARLKARLDKVVYSAAPQPATEQPVTVQPEQPKKTEQPNKETPVTGQPSAKAAEPRFYVVKKGDTVFGIARKNNISIKQLREMNNLNFEGVQEGQKLRIQ